MRILREEKFGYILYDSRNISYEFIPFDTNVEYDQKIPRVKGFDRDDIISSPIQVYFELTRKCNLSCRHCFTSSSKAAHEGMNTQDCLRTIDRIKEAGVINIRFTGGEPTTRPDWYDLLLYSKNSGLVVSLQTNGMFDNENETTSQIASLDIDQITVSIDGVGEKHDYLRGQGSYSKLLNSIKKMYKAGIILRFNTILTKDNIDCIPGIFDIASDYAVEINFFYLRPIGRGSKFVNLIPDHETHLKSLEIVKEQMSKYPDIKVTHSGLIRPKKNIDEKFPRIYSTGAFSALSIASNGTVWPHHYSVHQKADFALGSLPYDNILQIWNENSNIDKFRNWIKELYLRCNSCPRYMESCAMCDFEMEVARLDKQIDSNPLCIY